jgi:hypothetical protein
MPLGSLNDLLEKERANISLLQLIKMAHDGALGMEYLHSCKSNTLFYSM